MELHLPLRMEKCMPKPRAHVGPSHPAVRQLFPSPQSGNLPHTGSEPPYMHNPITWTKLGYLTFVTAPKMKQVSNLYNSKPNDQTIIELSTLH